MAAGEADGCAPMRADRSSLPGNAIKPRTSTTDFRRAARGEDRCQSGHLRSAMHDE